MPNTASITQPSPAQNSQHESLVLPSTGFIREKRLLKFVPFAHSTLWRKVADKSFPKPVKLSVRITAWRVEDVRDWQDKQQ
jgi:predicted DNA-binding transcriptional regulator AlpA